MVLAALVRTASSGTPTAGPLTVDASEFGLSEHEDASLALRRAVAACRERGAHLLILPPGHYHVRFSYAEEFTGSPSNGDRGIKPVALLLEGFKDLEVQATGVELLFQDQMVPVLVDHCRNVTIRGLTIDWEKLLAFDAAVVAVDPEHNSFDLAVHPDCVASIVDGVLLHGEDPEEAKHRWPYRQDLACSRFFDPKNEVWISEDPYTGDHAYQAWNAEKKVFATVEALGGNRYRFFNAMRRLPQVGWQIMSKGMRTLNRRSPAVWISGSINTILDDVRIYHAGGMGVIAEHSRDVCLNRVQIVPRPGSGRAVSTSADATHFSGCAGVIELADCTFAQSFDDGTNVHGIYFPVDRKEGNRSIIVSAGHFEQVGQRLAEPGDRIRFSDPATLKELQETTVVKIEPLNGHRTLLVLADALSPQVQANSIGENLTWNPDFYMHGCTIRSNVGRSFLVSTSGKVRIEDNHFYHATEMFIGGGPDAPFWFESGTLHDVTIRHNRFEGYTLSQPVLAFHRPNADPTSSLIVEDNDIATRGGPMLRLSGFDHIRFRNNRINSTASSPDVTGFILDNCRDIEIAHNLVVSGPSYSVELKNGSTGLEVRDNHGIASP